MTKKFDIEYKELRPPKQNHQHSLRMQQHSNKLAKKSQADVDWTKSIVREANKYPNGHVGKRERDRRLRQCALIQSKSQQSTS